MNGMNKTIYAIVSILALAYAGLCLFTTMNYTLPKGDIADFTTIHLYLFFPNADALGYDLTEFMHGLGMNKSLYGTMLDSLVGYLNLNAQLSNSLEIALMMAGFLIALGGFIAKPSWDVTGDDNNPAEYLWTHRPKAFSRCLLLPWGLMVGAWKRKKPLVIIPLLLLFLYYPWAIIISITLIPVFAIARGIVGLRIRSCAKREAREYSEHTDFGVCPHCKRNFERPKVKCRCGLVLDYPVPNRYGYKYHTCNKGHDIPCQSGRRSNLTTLCPHCGKQIDTREALPITISLVGGVGTGKTALMLASVETLTQMARIVDVTVDSPSDGLSRDALAAKDFAPKTIAGELESQVVFLKSMTLQDREIVFNDISGTEFQPNVDKVLFQEYYNYTNGIVFTFDPLPLAMDARRETPQEVFDSFHYMFTTIRHSNPLEVSDIPFAVVATKNDLMKTPLTDETVREFLMDHGQGDFVRLAEASFKNVRYFAVCSHGANCASAMRPVWWIAGFADKELVRVIPSP